MLWKMPVAVLMNWRGQGSRRTSLMHLKRYRCGKRKVLFTETIPWLRCTYHDYVEKSMGIWKNSEKQRENE